MSNIMSMADIKNRPSRNGFDLSFKKNFTAKAGELLPVMSKLVLPGDKFTINLKSFTRTQPLNTSAFARMREYFDFYFVPFSLLWNKFESCVTQMNSNVQHASGPLLDDNTPLSGSLPYFTSQQLASYLFGLRAQSSGKINKNPFGFDRGILSAKLLQYLGYGDYFNFAKGAQWSEKTLLYNLELSPFPLLAYQKIYSDYYRYTQWEKTNPSTFNLDYIKGTDDLQLDLSGLVSQDYNFFDIRYCNYQKDMFHGVIPVAQYGGASVAPINVSGSGYTLGFDYDGSPSPNVLTTDAANATVGLQLGLSVVDGVAKPSGNPTPATFSLSGGDMKAFLSVLALRQAEFLQKWKEVSVSGEEDYKSQIQKHWNISVSDYLSGQCRYLGGCASSLDINPVVNNNITGENSADIAGMGSFVGSGNIHFESKGEYGILMCIYHVLPIVDYVGTGVDHSCTLTDATSFPIPELDQIGMEAVPLVRAMNPAKSDVTISPETFLGYAPRYIDWKTSVDRSVGAFTGSLKTWCLPVSDADLVSADSINFPTNPNVESDSIQAGFFKVNPSIVDSLFAVDADSSVDTDEFLVSSQFGISCVRNLDRNGLPY